MIDHCPASPQELYLDGLELIMGESGQKGNRQGFDLDSLPAQSRSINAIARQWLNPADPLTADGISLMAGREGFSNLLRLCGTETGLLDPSIRMLPPRRRMLKGLDTQLHWLDTAWGIKSSFKEEGQELLIILPGMDGDFEDQDSNAASYFVQGLLQGLLTWISGGKFFPSKLERTGTAIRIQISREPID